MGLLDGGIRNLVGSVMGSFYLPGTLTRVSFIGDGEGGGTTSETVQPCRVQIDACTEAMRQQAGYTDTDVRILILQAGVTGGDVDTDCRLTAKGVDYAVAYVTQDPASSYWECRCQHIA